MSFAGNRARVWIGMRFDTATGAMWADGSLVHEDVWMFLENEDFERRQVDNNQQLTKMCRLCYAWTSANAT